MADAAATLMTIYSLTGGGDGDRTGPVTDGTDYEVAERIFGRDVRAEWYAFCGMEGFSDPSRVIGAVPGRVEA